MHHRPLFIESEIELFDSKVRTPTIIPSLSQAITVEPGSQDSTEAFVLPVSSVASYSRRVGIKKPIFNSSGFDPSFLKLSSYINELSNRPACMDKPIFTSMAKVKCTLYWELIENFYSTMKKFGHSDCSIMICISDARCIELCRSRGFPCFDYKHPDESVHTMQQVATVKLLHVGMALELQWSLHM
jgi:hypothetical protein